MQSFANLFMSTISFSRNICWVHVNNSLKQISKSPNKLDSICRDKRGTLKTLLVNRAVQYTDISVKILKENTEFSEEQTYWQFNSFMTEAVII